VIDELEPLVGEWAMKPDFPSLPPVEGHARVVFEWMEGGRFLIQRWEVPIPEAPDGLAIIGYDEGRGTLLQHYFDSRGVARVYEMAFDGRVWKLSRETEDFSPLSFKQRFEGTFSDDGRTIEGRWEKTNDGGEWELDFHMTYTRVD
jgi:hypothetical protein